jgi:predicted MFS family arabinose efflux permease
VNIPIALIALALIAIAKPVTVYQRAPMDYRGLALIVSGVALSVFGFQQSQIWGWGNPVTWLCVATGVALLVVFYLVERGTSSPLIEVSLLGIRPFFVENLVLFVSSLAFIPVFFFSSLYAQIALGEPALKASLVLLYFFIGFAVAAQLGGRMLDRVGAKRPVVAGCVLAAVGFWLWASKMTSLTLSGQVWYIILAGAGMGLMLGQSSTDAVNRASRTSYGEATGITQTVRNYAASLGIAILGTILVFQFRSHVVSSVAALGAPPARAAAVAAKITQSQGGGRTTATIPHFIRLDFAHASQTVFLVMAGIMAAAGVVALLGLERGRQEEPAELRTAPGTGTAEELSTP